MRVVREKLDENNVRREFARAGGRARGVQAVQQHDGTTAGADADRRPTAAGRRPPAPRPPHAPRLHGGPPPRRLAAGGPRHRTRARRRHGGRADPSAPARLHRRRRRRPPGSRLSADNGATPTTPPASGDLAIQGFETYMRTLPASPTWPTTRRSYIGKSYCGDGQFQQAVAAYEQVIQQLPGRRRRARGVLQGGPGLSTGWTRMTGRGVVRVRREELPRQRRRPAGQAAARTSSSRRARVVGADPPACGREREKRTDLHGQREQSHPGRQPRARRRAALHAGRRRRRHASTWRRPRSGTTRPASGRKRPSGTASCSGARRPSRSPSTCTKGKQIYVEGRLQTRQWDDKDGNKRYTTEIRATGSCCSGGGRRRSQQRRRRDGPWREQHQHDRGGDAGEPLTDDDIPF